MKTITYVIIGAIVGILFVAALYFIFNRPLTPTGIDVRVCVDITDAEPSPLNADDIIDLSYYGVNQSQEITIQTQTLSQYSVNETQELYMPSESFFNANKHKRKRTMAKLTKQLDTTLSKLYAEQSDKNRSNIFGMLLNCINDLSKSKNAKKVLIINSDMQDNIPMVFSCFKASDIELLKNHKDAVEQKLLQGNTLADMHGMYVYIIHKPRSQKDDDLFSLIVNNIYKRMYEAKGAKVYVQNNLFGH